MGALAGPARRVAPRSAASRRSRSRQWRPPITTATRLTRPLDLSLKSSRLPAVFDPLKSSKGPTFGATFGGSRARLIWSTKRWFLAPMNTSPAPSPTCWLTKSRARRRRRAPGRSRRPTAAASPSRQASAVTGRTPGGGTPRPAPPAAPIAADPLPRIPERKSGGRRPRLRVPVRKAPRSKARTWASGTGASQRSARRSPAPASATSALPKMGRRGTSS
mmetsp:Transcript_332/g.753  ORF Transcript_332/g.753 Transcript_332/m.753 type:complete len:219 (+) Transcript_332:602-1258(+)